MVNEKFVVALSFNQIYDLLASQSRFEIRLYYLSHFLTNRVLLRNQIQLNGHSSVFNYDLLTLERVREVFWLFLLLKLQYRKLGRAANVTETSKELFNWIVKLLSCEVVGLELKPTWVRFNMLLCDLLSRFLLVCRKLDEIYKLKLFEILQAGFVWQLDIELVVKLRPADVLGRNIRLIEKL